MESAPFVSVGVGVMKPLLSKIYKLLKDERGKLKGVRRQIEDTRDEMSSMEAALVVLAEAEQLNPVMTAWRDDVRELSYDMEDCVDDFMARVEHKHDGSTRIKKFFGRFSKLKPCHKIASEIEVLKARAVEASERHKRYNIDCLTPDSVTGAIDPRLEAFFVEVDELVGVDDPKKQIIEWLKRDISSTNLQVVSIVGPGGLGKITLANAVYKTIESEFSCSAFVSLSRKPNTINVLREIAERVRMEYKTNDDKRRLIEKLREHLQHKRYFIIIDDIWSTDEWNIIKHALWNNNCGSRIITTTRNSAVASYCSGSNGDIYTMEPLSFDDSRRLFLKRAVRPEELFPPTLEGVSEKILEKCAGLPLAIITMASLLADKSAEEEWKRVLAVIGSSLAKEAGDMAKILSLSYFDLPHPMRTCLLYLSAFPEDHIIKKKSLIHKWMAEGFIREVPGRSTYEVGEGYFNELINRSLIQPARDEMENGEVIACQIHDIILDFISCKAKEENFMTSFGDAEQGKKHKVRRLFVVSRKNEIATVSGDFSHVRSLHMFGYFWQNYLLDFPALRVLNLYLGQNFLLDFPALRVLNLEGCLGLTNDHLANIDKLLILKYLRLGWLPDPIDEIPAGIEKLKYLETLDMSDVKITKLPSTMARLQRLTRLYGDFRATCLSDGIIGQLHGLEELEKFEVLETELEMLLQELSQLTKLRTLSVNVRSPTLRVNVDNVRLIGTLISSYNFHHLTVRCNDDLCSLLSLESWCPANPDAYRKIFIRGYYIDKVPNWMASVVNLRELELCMYRTGPEDIVILGGIPALVSLTLETYYGRNGMILIRGFRSLKYFHLKLSCCGTAVEFEEGSMPKLEQLRLEFSSHEIKCVNYTLDFGIQHLFALTNVYVDIHGHGEEIRKLMKSALGKLRNRPTLLSLGRVYGKACAHFETAIRSMYELEAGSSHQTIQGGALCSYLGRIVEEITQDAMPLLGMLRSLDDLVRSLCAAGPSATAMFLHFARSSGVAPRGTDH